MSKSNAFGMAFAAFALGALVSFVVVWFGKVRPYQERDAQLRADLRTVHDELLTAGGPFAAPIADGVRSIEAALAEPGWFD